MLKQAHVINQILKKEAQNFFLIFRTNQKNNRNELVIKSKSSGNHLAVHTHVNFLDDDGNILRTSEITHDIAIFIFKFFDKRGDTHSFDIYESDFINNNLKDRKPPKIKPSQVRHVVTNSEKSYTATGDKLDAHWPIFYKLQETNHASIIRSTMTLHQVCSSHCHYCSTIARNKKDSISLDEAKNFVEKLYFDQAHFNKTNFKKYNDLYKNVSGSDIRLKGLILSGGGQPNLWPFFEEFVEWLSKLDIDLGLITNGFPKKISEDVYSKFKWIRISITPEDASPHYKDGQFNLQYLPKTIIGNKNITVGYSYVYGPWTNDDIIKRIKKSIDQNNFDYCRLLTDCNLSRSSQLKAHHNLAERLLELGIIDRNGNPMHKIFHQLKYHGDKNEADEIFDDGQCKLQSYNVFWDTTGHEDNGESFCYACDSITVLAEELSDSSSIKISERKFNHEKWGLVSNKNIETLYKEPIQPFFDPREVCSACLFMKNNKKVKDLTKLDDFSKLKISSGINHINFP